MLMTTRNNWLPEVFNEVFNDNFFMPRTVANNTPAINVIENKDSYVVELAAPGMTRDDIKVTLNEEQQLVIEVEKKTENKEENNNENNTGRYLRREFTHTKFTKTFILPEDIDLDAISATAHDGVLAVTLPRVNPEEEKREAKQIAIN